MVRKHLHKIMSHPGVRRYTKNLSWMLFARAFTLGVSFVTTLYIARVLGPTNFGELDYALAIIGVLAPLASFGLSNVLQRELIKHPEESNNLTSTAFSLNFLFALLATALVILYAFFSPVDSISRLLIAILSTTYTLGIFQLFQQEFYARAESKIPSLITMGVWITVSFIKVIILLFGKGVIWLAGASVLEQLLYAVGSIITYRRYINRPIRLWHLSSRFVPVMIRTGAATALVGFFTLIYARIDQIFIRTMMDAHAVGLYSAGVRLVDLWNIIPALLLGGLYPALVNARATSEELYRSRMRSILVVLTLSSVIIALSLSIAAPYLMKYIFGTQFIAGAPSLRVYAWSIVGTFLGQYVMNILFTDDYRKVLIATNIVPAVINVLLNLAFIPVYGIVGAAYATVISYSVAPLVPFFFSASRERILKTL